MRKVLKRVEITDVTRMQVMVKETRSINTYLVNGCPLDQLKYAGLMQTQARVNERKGWELHLTVTQMIETRTRR